MMKTNKFLESLSLFTPKLDYTKQYKILVVLCFLFLNEASSVYLVLKFEWILCCRSSLFMMNGVHPELSY